MLTVKLTRSIVVPWEHVFPIINRILFLALILRSIFRLTKSHKHMMKGMKRDMY